MAGHHRSLEDAGAALRGEVLQPVLSQTNDVSLHAHLRTNGISESMAHVGLRALTARAGARPELVSGGEAGHSSAKASAQAETKKIYVNPEVYEMIMRTAQELDSLQTTLERPAEGGSSPKRGGKWGKFTDMNRLVRGKPIQSVPGQPPTPDSPEVEHSAPLMLHRSGPPSPTLLPDSQQMEQLPSPSRRKSGGANWMQMLRPKPPKPVETPPEEQPVDSAQPSEDPPPPTVQPQDSEPLEPFVAPEGPPTAPEEPLSCPAQQAQPPPKVSSPVEYEAEFLEDMTPKHGASSIRQAPIYDADPNDPLSMVGGGRRRDAPLWEKYSKTGPQSPPPRTPLPDDPPAAVERASVLWREDALAVPQELPTPVSPKKHRRKHRTDKAQDRPEPQDGDDSKSVLSRQASLAQLSRSLSRRAQDVLSALDVDSMPRDEQLMEQLGQDGQELTGQVIEQRLDRAVRCNSASGRKKHKKRWAKPKAPRRKKQGANGNEGDGSGRESDSSSSDDGSDAWQHGARRVQSAARKPPPLPLMWRPAGPAKKPTQDIPYIPSPYQDPAGEFASGRGSNKHDMAKGLHQQRWQPSGYVPPVSSGIRGFWSADKPADAKSPEKSVAKSDLPQWRPAGTTSLLNRSSALSTDGSLASPTKTPRAVSRSVSRCVSESGRSRSRVVSESGKQPLPMGQASVDAPGSPTIHGDGTSGEADLEVQARVEGQGPPQQQQQQRQPGQISPQPFPCDGMPGAMTLSQSGSQLPGRASVPGIGADGKPRPTEATPRKVLQAQEYRPSPSKVVTLVPLTPPTSRRPAAPKARPALQCAHEPESSGHAVHASSLHPGQMQEAEAHLEGQGQGCAAEADADGQHVGALAAVEAPGEVMEGEEEEVMLYVKGVDDADQVGLPIRMVTYRDAGKVTAVTVKLPDQGYGVEFLLQESGLLPQDHQDSFEVVGVGAGVNLTTRRLGQPSNLGGREKSVGAVAPEDSPSKPFQQHITHPRSMALLPRLVRPSVDDTALGSDDLFADAHHAHGLDAVASPSARSAAASPVPAPRAGDAHAPRSGGVKGARGLLQGTHGSASASPQPQRPLGPARKRKGQDLVQLSAALQNQRKSHPSNSPPRDPAHHGSARQSFDLQYPPSPPRFPSYSKSSPQAISAATWRIGESHVLGQDPKTPYKEGACGSPPSGPASPMSLPPVGLHGRLQMRANNDPLKAAMETAKPLNFVRSFIDVQHASGQLPRLTDVLHASKSLDWDLCNSMTPQQLEKARPGQAHAQLQGLTLGLSQGLLLPKLSMHERRSAAYVAAEAAQLEAKLEAAAMARMTEELQRRNAEAERRRQEQWEKHPIAALMLSANPPTLTGAHLPKQQPPSGNRLKSPGHPTGSPLKPDRTGPELMSILNPQGMRIRPNGTPPTPGPPEFGKPSCYELGLPPMQPDSD